MYNISFVQRHKPRDPATIFHPNLIRVEPWHLTGHLSCSARMVWAALFEPQLYCIAALCPCMLRFMLSRSFGCTQRIAFCWISFQCMKIQKHTHSHTHTPKKWKKLEIEVYIMTGMRGQSWLGNIMKKELVSLTHFFVLYKNGRRFRLRFSATSLQQQRSFFGSPYEWGCSLVGLSRLHVRPIDLRKNWLELPSREGDSVHDWARVPP